MDKAGIGSIAAMLAWSGPAFAQQQSATSPPAPDFSKVEIKTTNPGNSAYMLESVGGNITVAAARNGIIMVPFAGLDVKWAPTELAARNFVRVVYHSLADKAGARQHS